MNKEDYNGKIAKAITESTKELMSLDVIVDPIDSDSWLVDIDTGMPCVFQ